MSTPADIIRTTAAEYMGDYGKATYADVIRAAHGRAWGTAPADAFAAATEEENAAAFELIAQLVEARHWRTGAEWPAEYAAALMVATFGTPAPTPADILHAADEGETAFWQAVADALPAIRTGDLDPGTAHHLTATMRDAVAAWADANG